MGKKRTDRVKIDVPVDVFEHLQEMAEARGVTAETVLRDAFLAYETSSPVTPPVRRRPSREEMEREFLEASLDPDRIQLSREWDATIGDGLSDK
jgi:hypothetical protein